MERSFRISMFRNKTDNVPIERLLPLPEVETLLTTRSIRQTKDGAAWSPAAFRTGTTRANDNVEGVCALVLDLDMPHVLDELTPKWDRWCYVVHTTHQHEPLAPRRRVIFPLAEDVPGEHWKGVYARLVSTLAPNLADPSCKDTSRIYFLPSCPAETSDKAEATTHAGELLDPNEFPPLPKDSTENRPQVEDKDGDLTPWNDYRQHTTWADLLAKAGGTALGNGYWCRPGKSAADGHSAHELDGGKLLHVFTDAWPPFKPGETYNLFEAYTLLEHRGDFKAAGRALAKLGFGSGAQAGKPESAEKQPESVARTLKDLAEQHNAEVFLSTAGHAFVRVPGEPVLRCAPIGSSAFKNWLRRLYFQTTGKTCADVTFDQATGLLTADATFGGQERREVYVRCAFAKGKIYIDLANERMEVIEIDKDDWRVLTESPVMFRYGSTTLPLPNPVRGGKLADEIRDVFNVESEHDLALICGWLPAALCPHVKCPMIVFVGRSGTGKSTAIERLHAMIDPSQQALRNPFRDERDLKAHAKSSWLISYDNVSKLTQDQSDNLCKLVTGGAISNRANYTDDDESLFCGTRRIALSSIRDAVREEDLLNRCVMPRMRILDGAYEDEDDLALSLAPRIPRILGAICDAVSMGLRNWEATKPPGKYRMAGFARFLSSAAPALGLNVDPLDAYARNRSEASLLAAEDSELVGLVDMLLDRLGSFQGNALALVTAMHETGAKESGIKPPTTKSIRGELRAAIPLLAAVGIHCVIERHTRTNRGEILLSRKGKPEPVASVASVAQEPDAPLDSPEEATVEATPATQEQQTATQKACVGELVATPATQATDVRSSVIEEEF